MTSLRFALLKHDNKHKRISDCVLSTIKTLANRLKQISTLTPFKLRSAHTCISNCLLCSLKNVIPYGRPAHPRPSTLRSGANRFHVCHSHPSMYANMTKLTKTFENTFVAAKFFFENYPPLAGCP